MAKKDKPIVVKDDIQIISPTLEKKVAEKKVSEDISIVQPEKTVVVEKMVKIKMKADHRCFIGGEWYYLLKGKQYNVPENVKNILLGADKLIPL